MFQMENTYPVCPSSAASDSTNSCPTDAPQNDLSIDAYNKHLQVSYKLSYHQEVHACMLSMSKLADSKEVVLVCLYVSVR